MDFSSILQIILNFIAVTFPSSTFNSTQIFYDIAGFVTTDNQTWNFIILQQNNNESNNSTTKFEQEIIFSEEIRPLWFALGQNGDDGSVNRIIYKRDSPVSPYLIAQLGKDNGQWDIQLLSDVKAEEQCFYDLTSLYCFDQKENGNRANISRINFCDDDKICVEKGDPISYQTDAGKVVELLGYDPCSSILKFEDENNVTQLRNFNNLEIVNGNFDKNDLEMCQNFSAFRSTPFSTLNLTSSSTNPNLSFLLQIRFRKPLIPCPPSNLNQTCIDANESEKTLFQALFYTVIAVFGIYITLNIVFLSIMFWRRRKMIQKMSHQFENLRAVEKNQERINSEQNQSTGVTSNKETENITKSDEKSMVTARQPRIFENESMITADVPSSQKQLEETTADKNDS